MAQTPYLVSSVLTGLLLVSVVVGLSRMTARRRTTPVARSDHRRSRGPTVGGDDLTVLGLLLVTGACTVVVVGVANVGDGGLLAAAAQLALLLLGVVLVGGFLVWGVHATVRHRGLQGAQAIGVGVWILGLVCVFAVGAVLLTAG